MHPIFIYAICIIQEYGWNVYPSTDESSMIVVGCLAMTVFAVWLGTSGYVGGDMVRSQHQQRKVQHEHAE